MNVPCPKCRKEIPVPEKLTLRGVARVQCPHCAFAFVVRLGEPGSSSKAGADRGGPIELLSVKASGTLPAAAGEIGAPAERFVRAQTQTLVRLDPEFEAELEGQGIRVEDGRLALQTAELAAIPEGADEDDYDAAESEESAAIRRRRTPTVDMRPGPAVPIESVPTLVEPAAEPQPEARTDAGATAMDGTPGPLQSGSLADTLPAGLLEPVPPPLADDDSAIAPGPPAPAAPAPLAPAAPAPAPTAPAFPDGARGLEGVLSLPATASLEPPPQADALLPYPPPAPPPPVGAVVFLALLFLLIGFVGFVLHKNDWSLDFANLDRMLSRAFGGADRAKEGPDELRGLLVSEPIVGTAKLKDSEGALTAQGIVKNNDTRPHRFIYVRATIYDNFGNAVAATEAPAGNLFSLDELSQTPSSQIRSRLNPAGRTGRNARVTGGESVEYMVIISPVPVDYRPEKYSVRAEVSKAEVFLGP